MPLDVIMPALGMAQDTGLIVAWHKQPGEAVAQGDVLFEVETDKATMEVEAQGAGFLTDVTAEAGAEVPVGNVIARISETAVSTQSAPQAPATDNEKLPEGKDVIMPTLGMSQDTGLLVAWLKQAGDAVSADDVLFEVETDKSTVEVNAGVDGFIAALLAEAGEEVPVGQTIAIISATAPANPITRSAASAAAPVAAAPAEKPAPKAEGPKKPAPKKAAPASTQAPAVGGPILASPKARRLAREQGLDLSRLVQAGHPQPYHVKDLDVLKALPTEQNPASVQSANRLTAELANDGFAEFALWAANHAGLTDTSALLAGLCAASLGRETVVAVETFGQSKTYRGTAQLSATTPSDDVPTLRLRDLRFTPISTVQVGAEDVPTLSLIRRGSGLAITLEYAGTHLEAPDAITLLSNFAGRMGQPLRHLL